MSTLTQEQIKRLTPEQQEALAKLEAGRSKRRQRLLVQARSYRGQLWLPALAPCFLYLVCFFASQRILPFLVALSLWVLITFHAAGINRRLDALMER